MEIKLEQSWKDLLKEEFEKPYFKDLTDFVRSEYQTKTVYPPPRLIFNALDSVPVDEVKVIIIGQDPYHGAGQAHGLSFSVPNGVPLPPSLKNIYKEIESDLGRPPQLSGNLSRWAKQGVLLLNATLTVRASQAASHQNIGWETFTDAVIYRLADTKKNLVFILWGSHAQKKCTHIDPNKHLILKSVHPSPLSAHGGFFGSRPFSAANQYLEKHQIPPINW